MRGALGVLTVGVVVGIVLILLTNRESGSRSTVPPPTNFGKSIERDELREITRKDPYQPDVDAEGNALVPPEPGKIYTGVDPLLSSEIMSPVTSAWKAGNEYDLTVVQAGASATHKSLGLLVIWRTSTRDATGPSTNLVEVPGAGTLRITGGPVGPSVVEWAPDRAKIEFRGSNDVRGVLSLADDSIVLDRAR